MKIIVFPTAAKRGRPRKPKASGPKGRVHVFPRAKNARLLSFIVKGMVQAAKRSSGGDPMDEAERVLIEHLEIDVARLFDIGVAEPEIEGEVRAFGLEAWREYVKHQVHVEPGVA
jgi:hypothetical protein